MNKDTFLIQLEKLLYDIPRDERDEAMDYYRSYFDDAGTENEALVMEELGSPQEIAASIKEGLNAGGDMSAFLKNPPQVREDVSQSGTYEYGRKEKSAYRMYEKNDSASTGSPFGSSAYTSGGSQGGTGAFGGSQGGAGGAFGSGQGGAGGTGAFGGSQGSTGASGGDQSGSGEAFGGSQSSTGGASGGAFYRRYNEFEKKYNKGSGGTMDRNAKLILIIILAICTLPVWGGIISAVMGIAGVVIAAVIVLGVCSAVFLIGGIVCAVVGIVRLCTLSLVHGLLTLGTGLLLVAGGGLSFVLLFLLCGRILPWAVRNGIQLCRRLFQFVGRSRA